VGFLNPKLYALQGTSALMDIASGGNATYPAAAGYDMSTGLGTPNVANLIQLLGNAPGLLAILDQLGPQFVTPGQTATFAVTTWPPAGGGAIPANPSFRWQRMPAGGATWANLEDDATHNGSLTPLLAVFGVTPAMNGDQFQCVVSDGSSTVTSAPAALTVGATGVTTLAGWPEAAGTADGIGRLARFDFVGSVRLDSKGNVYAVDAGNDTIRRITPQGVVTTFAGTPGMTGSTDGPVAGALFDDPGGVAVDPKGNVFVADSGNYTVREISTAGQVTTLAGSPGVQGTADGTGLNARFYNMQNIAADSLGNLYVVDGTSDTVRKIVISTGAVTTIAGSPGVAGGNDDQGNYALFNNPTGVATDASGNIYVSDTGNDKIRKITPTGAVTTIATIAPYQGPFDTVQAASSAPAGLGVDASGNIFVGCTGDNTVREIAPGGSVSLVAGEGGDPEDVDGPLATARFGFPDDIAVDPTGVLYVADGINNTVRRILQNPIAPVIAVQPTSQTVNLGSTVVLSASVTGAVSYQWMDYGSLVSNGAGAPSLNTDLVSGADGPVLVISSVSYLTNGTYTLIATGPDGGTISSSPVTISVVASTSPGAVTSLSSRAFVGTGDNILIGGFYIVGNTSATVLVQAIGPGIGVSPYNVSGVLQHPEVAIHQNQNGKDVILYDNAGWGSSQLLLNAAAAAYALPVLSPGSPDSELLVTLPPGGYTAEVTGADGGTGVALCAIYQLP
jgi:sugar lactone lactonase YvrE